MRGIRRLALALAHRWGRRSKRPAPLPVTPPSGSNNSAPSDPDWLSPWTASQRRALVVLFSAVCLLLIVRCVLNPRYVSDPPPDPPARGAELADRIDPNTADWNDLAAIPNLGEKRAQAIAAYRDAHKGASRGPVFRSADDLMAVRGIGYATATKLKPYLIFPPPAAPPDTRP